MSLWNDEFLTGNELVDNDHKQIFSLVEDVLESSIKGSKEKNETAINFLAEYVVSHFAREEKLMEESDYPNAVSHKKEHMDFMAVAVKLKEDFDNGGYAFGELEMHPDTIHLSKVINDTVVSWLLNHVMDSDKDLAAHYRKAKGAT
ncbi:MAG: hemerythrin family protein [Defluviitaleaceae bacterium]|nr:hemerythrin family protein [Defluviitaleaceae bacterium]